MKTAFTVREKGKRSIITNIDEESQGTIDFDLEENEELTDIRSKKSVLGQDAMKNRKPLCEKLNICRTCLKKRDFQINR